MMENEKKEKEKKENKKMKRKDSNPFNVFVLRSVIPTNDARVISPGQRQLHSVWLKQ